MATRLPILDFPVKTNQIPRQIPPAPIVAHPVLLFFSAGEQDSAAAITRS
jgi:transmembrane 9 superfamily protein 2/4